ncbi:MAG: PEP-CTERM sorting domain-containing protein [Cyanobacteria bacterium J06639_14]
MKYFALAATAALSAFAIATPANAALFSWDVEYTGWWEEEGGGALSGSFVADEADADDGIVGLDEVQSWTWDWSGNDLASSFSISSSDEGAEIQVFDVATSGFYVDGTANEPGLLDGLDQGVFVGGETGELVLDLEFLIVENNSTTFPTGPSEVSLGNVDSETGSITVGDPKPVPEPATILGLIALGAGSLFVRKQVA